MIIDLTRKILWHLPVPPQVWQWVTKCEIWPRGSIFDPSRLWRAPISKQGDVSEI